MNGTGVGIENSITWPFNVRIGEIDEGKLGAIFLDGKDCTGNSRQLERSTTDPANVGEISYNITHNNALKARQNKRLSSSICST